jgi:hypothetical protein
VKILGRCRNCGREFPIDLVLSPPDTAGLCPFDGKPLDAEYQPILIEALEALQLVGNQMETILERAVSVGENLELNAESILGPIREALGAREQATAQRRATREASLAEGSPGNVEGSEGTVAEGSGVL